MVRKIFSLLILLLLTIPTAIAQTDDWEVYETSNYRIEYPPNWELDTTGIMHTSFIILSEPEPNDRFQENVNLLIQDVSGKSLDLDGFVELTEQQVRNTLPGSTLIESERVRQSGLLSQRLTYIGNMNGSTMKVTQYCWVITGKAYILTYTAQRANYEDYIDIAEKIMATFVFNDF